MKKRVYFGIIIAIFLFITGTIFGYGNFQAKPAHFLKTRFRPIRPVSDIHKKIKLTKGSISFRCHVFSPILIRNQ